MSIFISDKDTATLCVQLFLNQNHPKSKYKGQNKYIYIGYVEAVQKIRSPVLSGLKTRGDTPARFLNST